MLWEHNQDPVYSVNISSIVLRYREHKLLGKRRALGNMLLECLGCRYRHLECRYGGAYRSSLVRWHEQGQL